MQDLRELYQAVIIDHNKRPRHYGKIDEPTHQAEGYNPLCGDKVELAFVVVGGKIETVGFETASCAICKASASMLAQSILGQPVDDLPGVCRSVGRLIRDGEASKEGPAAMGEDLVALAGVGAYPARIPCAELPWTTLMKALGCGHGSTEGASWRDRSSGLPAESGKALDS